MRLVPRHRPQPALVVSSIALFVALGGSSYAALKLERNSVGASQIKKEAVRSAEVKNRSLLARDFRRGQLPRGARGAQGVAGPGGAQGPQGPGGPGGSQGPAGSAVAYAHVLANGTLDAARTKNVIDVRPTCAAPCATVPPPGPSAIQCFKLGFTPTNAVANGDYDYGTAVVVGVRPLETYGPALQCPSGYDAARAATTDENGSLAALGFFIAFN